MEKQELPPIQVGEYYNYNKFTIVKILDCIQLNSMTVATLHLNNRGSFNPKAHGWTSITCRDLFKPATADEINWLNACIAAGGSVPKPEPVDNYPIFN